MSHDTALQLEITSPATSHPDPIVALRNIRTGEEIKLAADCRRVVLGSGEHSDVIIADPYISTTHCVLEQRDQARTVVRDRHSKNGTFVNGNRVELAELRPGALLRLGDTTLLALGRRQSRIPRALERLRGEDPGFRRAVDMALRAATTDCSVLVVGETGTGKELVAAAVHEASPRAHGPLVAVNCGAISQELIGSELFGHERGSFTGAATSHDGVFVQANGGTLFLDELGELPLDQQPHLLRVLEARTVRRLGGSREESVDVRLVAATNRLDLTGGPSARLRLDLYHRVATVTIELPPLRERSGDIPLLVQTFIDDFAPELGTCTISRATLHALTTYSWPGNVRELRQAVRRAMTLCQGELTIDHLLPSLGRQPPPLRAPKRTRQRRYQRRPTTSPSSSGELRPIDIILRDVLLDSLDKHGSMRSAAEALGLPKSTFADWARRLGIETR